MAAQTITDLSSFASLDSLASAPKTATVRTIDARLLELALRAIRESRASGTLTIQFRNGCPCGAARLEQYT